MYKINAQLHIINSKWAAVILLAVDSQLDLLKHFILQVSIHPFTHKIIVVQWLAPSHQRKKAQGFDLNWGWGPLQWVYTLSLCLPVLPLGSSASSHSVQSCTVRFIGDVKKMIWVYVVGLLLICCDQYGYWEGQFSHFPLKLYILTPNNN